MREERAYPGYEAIAGSHTYVHTPYSIQDKAGHYSAFIHAGSVVADGDIVTVCSGSKMN